MHEYKPRGIVKWAPFAALTDYTDAVNELYERLEEEEVEVRNNEFSEYLNECLNKIIVDQSDVYVEYRVGNQVKALSGVVQGLGEKEIILSDTEIDIHLITDIVV